MDDDIQKNYLQYLQQDLFEESKFRFLIFGWIAILLVEPNITFAIVWKVICRDKKGGNGSDEDDGEWIKQEDRFSSLGSLADLVKKGNKYDQGSFLEERLLEDNNDLDQL